MSCIPNMDLVLKSSVDHIKESNYFFLHCHVYPYFCFVLIDEIVKKRYTVHIGRNCSYMNSVQKETRLSHTNFIMIITILSMFVCFKVLHPLLATHCSHHFHHCWDGPWILFSETACSYLCVCC